MTFQPSEQPAVAAPVPIAWSPPQVLRLQTEWGRLQRSFACHPFVQVTPLAGDPPGEFQVQYKVRTLAFNQQNVLTYVTGCPIHIWLPPQFPHAPPAVRPVAPIFHPNVTMEWIYLPGGWHVNMTLEQVVTTVGQLLAYQTWDPNQNANPMAMEWLAQNQHLCPTDPFATFGADTEGGPAARIAKFGAEHLDLLRKRVLRMCDRQTVVPPPEAAEVKRFAQQTLEQLGAFAEGDVPDPLRAASNELGDVVRSMQAPNSPWRALAGQFTSINAIAMAAENAAQAFDATKASEDALAKLTPDANHRGDPVSVLLALPPASELQNLMLDLRRAVRDAERLSMDLRQRSTAGPSALPEVNVAPGSLLHERLTADVARATEASAAAKGRMGEVLDGSERSLAAARLALTVAERMVDWSEYAELLRRADLLLRKVTQFGPDGVQSYTLKVGEKVLGPFEYEQRLDDVVGARYAVSNLGTPALDLVDTRGGTVVAHADSGDVSTVVKGKNDQPVTLTAHPAVFNEELLVQFEYILTQTKDRFTRLSVMPAVPFTDSWLGEHEAFFRMPASRMALGEENKQRRQRLKGVILDLGALGRFKLRLATYFLLERVGELVPRVHAEIARSQERLDAANKRLAEIAARAGRDFDTQQLIIPAKFVKEHTERSVERDRATRDIPRFHKLLANAGDQIRRRLSATRLTGAQGLPSFYVVPPLAEHWADFEAVLSDADLLARVENLEAALGVILRTPGVPLFGVASEGDEASPEAPTPLMAQAPPGIHSPPMAQAPPGVSGGIPVGRALPPAIVGGAAMASARPRMEAEPSVEEVPQGVEYADPQADESYAGQEHPEGEAYVEEGAYEQPTTDDPFAVIEDDSERQDDR